MRIAFWVGFFLAVLLTSLNGVAQDQTTLKVATYEMPPYISNADEKGYLRETIQAVFQALDRELSFEFYPFLRAPKIVESGAADILAPAFIDIGHSSQFVYSEPFGDFILDAIQSQRFPKGTAPTDRAAELLLFFEIWPAIGISLGDSIHAVLESKISPQEALDRAQIAAMRVMYQSGFYSPSSPRKKKL